MSVLELWHWSEWDVDFYRSDCSRTDLSFLGLDDLSLTTLFLSYLVYVLLCGYIYGRHKGLSNSRGKFIDGVIKARLIELSSKIWFLLSTFVFPWYLCIVWLFYSMHNNDFHYVNDYNPWILPITVIYCAYSIVIMASYRYYSHSDTFSKISVRTSMVYGACLTVCILFIMVQNENNNPEQFSSDGFHGHEIRYCFDLDVHRNPIILSILLILYGSITHHLFVTLRVITAKCCDHEYIEKTVEFYSKRKQKRLEKFRKKRKKRDHQKSQRKLSYNPDDGTMYEYDSSTLDDYDIEMSESVGIHPRSRHERDRTKDVYYLKKGSDSNSGIDPLANAKARAAAQMHGNNGDLELELEHVISAEVECRNPRPMSVYV